MKLSVKAKDEFLKCITNAVNRLEDIDLEKMDFNNRELMEQLNEATLYLEKAKFILSLQQSKRREEIAIL